MIGSNHAVAVSTSIYPQGHVHSFWRILDEGYLCSIAARRPKSSLTAASAACLERLHRVAAQGTSVKAVDVISIYNNAALLFYHNGRLRHADDLTLHSLRLCAAEWKRTAGPAWLAAMLQPYVNLGRLAFARNEYTDAISFYRTVYEYVWHGKSFQVHDCCFTPDLLDEFRDLKNEDLSLDPFSAAVYLTEGARALLARGDFDSLADFVTTVASEIGVLESGRGETQESCAGSAASGTRLTPDQAGAVKLIVAELQARAFAGRRKYDEALALYASLTKRLPRQRPGMIGIYSSAAELLRKRGRFDDALKLLDYAGQVLQNLAQGPGLELECYQAHFGLGLQYSCLGHLSGTHAHAQAAWECARACDHHVGKLRAQALLTLAHEANSHEPAGLAQDLDICMEQINRCMYPLERACGLLELAEGLGDSATNAGHLRQMASETLCQLIRHGGSIPSQLAGWAGVTAAEMLPEACSLFSDPVMEELYERLVVFAASRAG